MLVVQEMLVMEYICDYAAENASLQWKAFILVVQSAKHSFLW